MIITPAILGVLVLALLGYFGYSYMRRRAEKRQREEEPTPFMFGGARAAVDLLAEMGGPAGSEQRQQRQRTPRAPRTGRRRNHATDEKVAIHAQAQAAQAQARAEATELKPNKEEAEAAVFFNTQMVTRRPSTGLPGQDYRQAYPLVQTTGKEVDPFEVLDHEASPNTPATKRARGAPPAPINAGLAPPEDAPGAGLTGGILPFTPLPQYPTSAHAASDEGHNNHRNRRTRRGVHPPVAGGNANRFKLRVVNAGKNSRSSSQRTHSTRPSGSGSIEKRPMSASTGTGESSTGVYEPPTYTRPPSYANSHSASSTRSHPDMPPLTTLLQLIGAGSGHASGGEDSQIITSPVSVASGGAALRDSGLFPSTMSTGDYKGHQSRKSYASTRRSLASIQDVQAVPGPSSQPMTPPVPSIPLSAAAVSPSSFMYQDPSPSSRRVSAASSRRQSKRTRAKAQPLRSDSATAVATPSSSAPSSAHPARMSLMSEMDITSLNGGLSDGQSSRPPYRARASMDAKSVRSVDVKSARSVDVTSLYQNGKGKIARRDSSGSSDGVPAIPPLPEHTPFDFDMGFGGGIPTPSARDDPVPIPQASSPTSPSDMSTPLTSMTPFFTGTRVSSVPTSASVLSDTTERDPWAPAMLRSSSVSTSTSGHGYRVRRKPVPSEASFASFGSETALLKGKERSDTIGSIDY
ncbi:hypothetical protein EXIGLDRAFT_340931 [Exidia glandulosa HHB12029]|uniref:Uncharacterized protein n=1 Tax=Exidia glandulosa HHB12029 TaxID=1314781 RepID=A0A165CIF7_EXIGL|nr:hypothetical protein EXIGLDRAFT_340931 [Exidia glandulosa HHB12029]